MKPVRTMLTDLTFTLEGGTEENNLPVITYSEQDGGPCFGSTWQLTDEERTAIATGSNVELLMFSSGHPPVAIRLSDYQLDDNQGDSNGLEHQ